MLKSKIRKEIVTNWILSSAEYQRLQKLNSEIKDFVYNLSWKGHENFKNKKFEKYLSYELRLDNNRITRESEILGDYTWKHSYYYYCLENNMSIKMFDPEKIDISSCTELKNGTLSIDWDKVEKEEKEELKKLVDEKLTLVVLLYKIANLITQTLLNSSINMTYIKKYYPDLIK